MLEFYQQPLIHLLNKARLPGDTLIILGVTLLLIEVGPRTLQVLWRERESETCSSPPAMQELCMPQFDPSHGRDCQACHREQGGPVDDCSACHLKPP